MTSHKWLEQLCSLSRSAINHKKRRLWKRITEYASGCANVSACNEVRKVIHKNISIHEKELVSLPSQAAFYKYIDSRLSHHVRSPTYLVAGKYNHFTNNASIAGFQHTVCKKFLT